MTEVTWKIIIQLDIVDKVFLPKLLLMCAATDLTLKSHSRSGMVRPNQKARGADGSEKDFGDIETRGIHQ